MTVIDQKHAKELNAISFSWILSIFFNLKKKNRGGGAAAAPSGISKHMNILGIG